jgi:hypothetical protein
MITDSTELNHNMHQVIEKHNFPLLTFERHQETQEAQLRRQHPIHFTTGSKMKTAEDDETDILDPDCLSGRQHCIVRVCSFTSVVFLYNDELPKS